MSSKINLDLDREERLGFPEAVYGERKDVDSLLKIIDTLKEKNIPVLITRLQDKKFEHIVNVHHDAFYDASSGFCYVGEMPEPTGPEQIGILSAGTTDSPVVNEAYYTLKCHNMHAGRIQDIGVAGLHRLLSRLEDIKKFTVLIVVAGFEGALPTVVGGLLPQPVIAVPTSVGYGVAAGGNSALTTMLASCASGITVVNIDNGYGAAMAALRIVNQLANR
jgi:NCAIR mutase (PurE)-related protein